LTPLASLWLFLDYLGRSALLGNEPLATPAARGRAKGARAAPLANPALPNCPGLRLPSSPAGHQARHQRVPDTMMADSASCLVACSPPSPRPDRGETDPISQQDRMMEEQSCHMI